MDSIKGTLGFMALVLIFLVYMAVRWVMDNPIAALVVFLIVAFLIFLAVSTHEESDSSDQSYQNPEEKRNSDLLVSLFVRYPTGTLVCVNEKFSFLQPYKNRYGAEDYMPLPINEQACFSWLKKEFIKLAKDESTEDSRVYIYALTENGENFVNQIFTETQVGDLQNAEDHPESALTE